MIYVEIADPAFRGVSGDGVDGPGPRSLCEGESGPGFITSTISNNLTIFNAESRIDLTLCLETNINDRGIDRRRVRSIRPAAHSEKLSLRLPALTA
jgi:hypothetical protein